MDEVEEVTSTEPLRQEMLASQALFPKGPPMIKRRIPRACENLRAFKRASNHEMRAAERGGACIEMA